MRGRGARGVGLALLLAAAPAGAQPPGAPIHFEGELVVGLRAQPSEAALRADVADAEWRFEELFDGRAARDPAAPLPDDAAAAEPGFYWLRPERPQAADAAPAAYAGPGAWDLAHAVVDGTAPAPYDALAGALAALGPDPLGIVEPELYYTDAREAESLREAAADGCDYSCENAGTDFAVCGAESPHWTAGRFGWQLDASRLKQARAQVPPPASEPLRVKVAHLDTGYADNDALKPERFTTAGARDFVDGDLDTSDPCTPGKGNSPGHGTKTLSVLAGNHAKVVWKGQAFDAPLGGAPEAGVVEYRVGNSVIHLNPIRLADAIGWAAEQQIDVISLSMGGLPSWTLRDAVNRAYDHGTAIIAAAGNHYAVPFWVALSPSTLVYPARFSRVVAVTGVAYDGRPYGKGPGWWSLVRNGDFEAWSMRGNYGPPWRMDEALAGFTPNVSWSRKGPPELPKSRLVSVSGGGTSAATPQVAAAAALWLQLHRGELAGTWNGWQKAEAVYRALLSSVQPYHNDAANVEEYLGTGALDAMAALAKSPASLGPLAPRREARIGLDWVFFGIGPLADAADPAAARRAEVHERMLRVELAQLVYGSQELEVLLGEADPASPRDAATRVAFLRAAREDPHASEYLKSAIDAALR